MEFSARTPYSIIMVARRFFRVTHFTLLPVLWAGAVLNGPSSLTAGATDAIDPITAAPRAAVAADKLPRVVQARPEPRSLLARSEKPSSAPSASCSHGVDSASPLVRRRRLVLNGPVEVLEALPPPAETSSFVADGREEIEERVLTCLSFLSGRSGGGEEGGRV